MFQFKALTEEEHEEERIQVLWQMLNATLSRSHGRMMDQYDMPVLDAPSETAADPEGSMMRSKSYSSLRAARVGEKTAASRAASKPTPKSGTKPAFKAAPKNTSRKPIASVLRGQS